MKRIKYALLLLALASVANAAKVTVFWKNPSTNTDGSPLTDLSYIEIEWGTCVGVEFGVKMESAIVVTMEVGKEMSSPIYTTVNLSTICIRAIAYNMKGAPSPPSNTAVKMLLPKPGKPVTLGAPVILQFKPEK